MLQTFPAPTMLQMRELTWLKTPDLASFLDGSLINQIPAALTNCQSFLREDTTVLEKGQVLKTTALDARGPFHIHGDKEAMEMDSKLYYSTSPIQEKSLHCSCIWPFISTLLVQLVHRKASCTKVLVLEIH